jgi:o-succinylbenzoate synthase
MARLVELRLFPVSGELARPAGNAQQTWNARAALLVHLIDADGRIGCGEASPLPGYSSDSLARCEEDLTGLRAGELPAPEPGTPVEPQLRELGAQVAAPAARFALECAWLDLLGQATGRSLAALLGRVAFSSIPLAALVDAPSEAESLALARLAVAKGIRVLKLKVGRPGAFDRELALARRLRHELGPEVALRLDANRAWSPEETPARLAALAEIAPELVEEPSPIWPTASPVPLALDETLQQPDSEVCLRALSRVCRAIVLKPMALGGFTRCLALARLAGELGLDVVVSHLFDGPIALAAAAELALALPRPPRACGLARHAGLSAWPAVEIPQIGAHSIEARPLAGLGVKVDP